MSADLHAVLEQAHAIVTDQLTRLRELAERARRAAERQQSDLRQVERQLDEALMQQRLAANRGGANKGTLARRSQEARQRHETLLRDTQAAQHALKQLEQLIRQIEMSSGALTEREDDAHDPWVLALRAQVIHGREEERVRLAREVHDGPAQVLANALMILETCYGLAQQAQHDKLTLMLDRTRGAVKEGMHDVRRFIADLRPGRLEDHGLAVAITEYVRGYANAYNARVQIEIEPLPRQPIEREIVLYRIVQEALQNAHKYARGVPIAVRLAQQNGTVRLLIRDEGPGFDVYEVAQRAGRSSWGLMSMRERAELIGAQFTVTSSLGHGTEVLITLPLDR